MNGCLQRYMVKVPLRLRLACLRWRLTREVRKATDTLETAGERG